MINQLRLTLTQTIVATDLTALIATIRRHTGKPISSIQRAIRTQQAFLDETPQQNDYDHFITSLRALLDDLEAQKIEYQIEIDGDIESPTYLRNLFTQWKDIQDQMA